MGRPRRTLEPGEEPRDVKTSIIISPRARDIAGSLVAARFAMSQSEAIEKIITAWSESERGKTTIEEARERIKNGWNPFS